MRISDNRIPKVIFRNSLASIIQVGITTVTMFVVYSYMVRNLGVEVIGVWSILTAVTNSVRIGELGFAGSIIKYVAKYIATDDLDAVRKVILTGTTSITISLLVLILIAYPGILLIFQILFERENLHLAKELLPLSLIYLLILSVGGLFTGGLEGCLRTDLKSIILIIGSLINFLLSIILLPKMGLLGLLISLIIQAIVQMLASWVLLRKQVPELPLFPFGWSNKIFKEIFSYSLNFQVINISVMLFEPITKFLLGLYGGLEITGYYDMARRIVNQVRAFIAAANRTIVPMIAEMKEKSEHNILLFFFKNMDIIGYLVIVSYFMIAALTPLISKFWIGEIVDSFMVFMWIILIGDAIAIILSPSYYVNLGTGNLKWNVIAHISKVVMNLFLGIILGQLFGGLGVIIGFSIANLSGSLIRHVPFMNEHRISLKDHFSKFNILLLAYCACILGVSIFLYFKYILTQPLNITMIFGIVVFFLFLLGAWHHPLRKELLYTVLNFQNRK